jgi:Uma2 family endonuclease
MDRATFHARYQAMHPHFRAELIEGVVHVPSPLKYPHGTLHPCVSFWLMSYHFRTPGTRFCDSVSTLLGNESELQPDLSLIIEPGRGGATRLENGYLHGPPELVIEIASASESFDLNAKRRVYEDAGVLEYLVVAVQRDVVYWFVRRDGAFAEMAPGGDGIYRSEAFPGLWLDAAALWCLDGKRLTEVLHQGCTTLEHAAFVAKLAAAGEVSTRDYRVG